jgi:hypothetical protein
MHLVGTACQSFSACPRKRCAAALVRRRGGETGRDGLLAGWLTFSGSFGAGLLARGRVRPAKTRRKGQDNRTSLATPERPQSDFPHLQGNPRTIPAATITFVFTISNRNLEKPAFFGTAEARPHPQSLRKVPRFSKMTRAAAPPRPPRWRHLPWPRSAAKHPQSRAAPPRRRSLPRVPRCGYDLAFSRPTIATFPWAGGRVPSNRSAAARGCRCTSYIGTITRSHRCGCGDPPSLVTPLAGRSVSCRKWRKSQGLLPAKVPANFTPIGGQVPIGHGR